MPMRIDAGVFLMPPSIHEEMVNVSIASQLK